MLTVNPRAVHKICGLMAEQAIFLFRLRVYITGGGCQGFQYGFAFELEKEKDDVEFFTSVEQEHNGPIFLFLHMLVFLYWERKGADGEQKQKPFFFLSVLVDPISFQYLNGAEVDYVLDGHGERFLVKNPNAKTTCGCDRSFTTA